MSAHQFGGGMVFGQFTVTLEGPTPSYRAQTETLPGVDGERVYRLGRGVVTWVIGGRISAGSMAGLKTSLMKGAALMDGRLYTFRDSDGASYPNCRLVSYVPHGPVEGVSDGAGREGVTQEIRATVVWESPSGLGTSNGGATVWGIVPGFPTLDFSGGDGGPGT